MGTKPTSKPEVSALATKHALYPQEKPLKVSEKLKSLSIGIPKETCYQENRICLNPKSVEVLVNNGHKVTIESGAGDGAKFKDREYSEAGAQIVYSPKEVYENQLILKIEPPSAEELQYLKPDNFLISALQIGDLKEDFLSALQKKKMTAVAFEFMENKGQEIPIMRAMGEIAGYSAIFTASELLSSMNKGKGLMLGSITGVAPTNIVILGAGSVAENATRAAVGLGANVKVFDNHIYRLRRLKNNIGFQIFTSTLDTSLLAEELKNADVVIGALRPENGRTPCVVTEKMVSEMREGAVIIDVSIDHGGCFETSKITDFNNPTYEVHNVIHYCLPNIASRYARTASIALSNIFTPLLLKMGELGGVEELILCNEHFMKGTYLYKGSLTNQNLARRFGMQYKELSLLLAARY